MPGKTFARIAAFASLVLASSLLFAQQAATLTIHALQVAGQIGSMDLCESCTQTVIRATKKYSYGESVFFPENFGRPELLPSLPSPPIIAHTVAELTSPEACSVLPSAKEPNSAPVSDETSPKTSGDTNE